MLRRLMPYFVIVLLVLFDIAVVPIFSTSVYLLPATLLFVMCFGLLLGRTHGMLGGLLGGLLIDILVGFPLGYMTFTYIAGGYFAGLIGYDTDEMRVQENYSRTRALVRRLLAIALILTFFEAVTMVYQYFNTALLEGAYIRCAFVRVLIGTVFTNLLYYPLTSVLVGSGRARMHIGPKREVKNL